MSDDLEKVLDLQTEVGATPEHKKSLRKLLKQRPLGARVWGALSRDRGESLAYASTTLQAQLQGSHDKPGLYTQLQETLQAKYFCELREKLAAIYVRAQSDIDVNTISADPLAQQYLGLTNLLYCQTMVEEHRNLVLQKEHFNQKSTSLQDQIKKAEGLRQFTESQKHKG